MIYEETIEVINSFILLIYAQLHNGLSLDLNKKILKHISNFYIHCVIKIFF